MRGRAVLGLESPSYGELQPGEPGTAVPRCLAWLPPVSLRPAGFFFSASRLRVRPATGNAVLTPALPRSGVCSAKAVLGLESPSYDLGTWPSLWAVLGLESPSYI
jgi:hypothetical protein